MACPDAPVSSNRSVADLMAENELLRAEIRVAREAAEITAHLVVEQFEKADGILTRFQVANTQLIASNEELEAAKERLQKLDQLKSDFLSSVSHELRTPLTSIRGFAHLVDREFSRSFAGLANDDPGLTKKAGRIAENLAVILKESDRLTRLINDVLDLAKIEAGRIEWRDTRVHPGELARDAVNATHGMFEQKTGVELRLEVEPDLPRFLGDADRMQQVLVNLINNAAKFTDIGAVTVRVARDEAGIRIEISDTGIGFPPEEAERIFDKFQQARHGDTLEDRPKGTGLGLAISREIVERHGGRIRAASTPGKGSVFTVTLPSDADTGNDASAIAPDDGGHAAPPMPDARDHNARRKVLVVDDDAGIRGYLAQLLQENGYGVVTATDGHQALVEARRHRPDLITMDLAMPVMDGRAAIAALRADPELGRIPVMVISAIPGWESSGGDLAMSKPIEEAHFLRSLHSLLRDEVGAESAGVRFLVLHENDTAGSVPNAIPTRCEVQFCALGELRARIDSGFRGMVVVPSHLIDKVDLGMLNALPSLEVMIMPERSQPLESKP